MASCPKPSSKAIRDSIEISDKAETAKLNTRRMGKLEREAAIDRLTREMKQAAKLLDFENAAFCGTRSTACAGREPHPDSDAEAQRRQTPKRGRKHGGKTIRSLFEVHESTT